MDILSKEIIALNGKDKIKIHGLKVGELSVKKSVLNSKRPGLLSTLLSFMDKEFGDWLPVWVWVVEHPEGIILIDTGLSSDVKQQGYFKSLDFMMKYYFEKQMLFKIDREEEVDYRLKEIGVEVESISKAVLTHLHIDHVGGMKHFPNTPIFVNDIEWKTKDGAAPKLFPPNINIEKTSLDSKFESFEECHYLTRSKDLVMIHTPGHTRGHVSIALIADKEKIFLFGGDIAYTEKRLRQKSFSATINSHKENTDSCNKILELSKKYKVIFLPSHDVENISRFESDSAISVNMNKE